MQASADGKTFLPISKECFVCGEDNGAGLHTRFYVEDGLVKADLFAEPRHCGYRDIVHGGITAALLDECMGWAAARAIGRMCLTGELTVRYLKRVPCRQRLIACTEITKKTKWIVDVSATLTDEDGVCYAKAKGRFLPLSVEETLAVDDGLVYQGGEERVFSHLRAGAAKPTSEG
jgi:uncharacterized protein (TIGR00369 family)